MKQDTLPMRQTEANIEEAEYQSLAKIAQARKRAEAPEMTIKEAMEIPQKRLIRLHCPECVGPNATHHAMFGDKTLLRQYVEQDGYEPIFDRGHMVTYGKGGDPLLRIPKDLHERMKKASVLRSERMLQAKGTEEDAANVKNPASGGERVKIVKSGEKGFEEAAHGQF